MYKVNAHNIVISEAKHVYILREDEMNWSQKIDLGGNIVGNKSHTTAFLKVKKPFVFDQL